MKKLLSLLMLVAGTASAQLTILPLSGFPTVATMSNGDYIVVLIQTGGGHYTNRNLPYTNLVQLLQQNTNFFTVTNIQAGTNMVITTNNGVLTLNVNLTVASNFIPTLNGLGTNLYLIQNDDTFTNGALTIFSFTNNINSALINLYGRGSNSAAIVHYQNDVSNSVDYGLWGSTFGLPFSNRFVFDTYNANDISTKFGPGLFFGGTGVYAATGDSGVVYHPVFWLDPTNLQLNFSKANTDDRTGTVVTTFNGPTGLWKSLGVASPSIFTGPGTLSINLAGVVTGSSTSFDTTFKSNKLFFVGTTNYQVVSISSATSMTVSPNGLQSAGSSYQVYPNSAYGFGILGSDKNRGWHFDGGNNLILYGANGSYIALSDSATPAQWWMQDSFGNFNIFNVVSNKSPFYIDKSAGNNEIQLLNGKAVFNGFQLPVNTNHAGYFLTTDANGNGSWSTNVSGLQSTNGVTAQHFAGLGAVTVTSTNTGAGTGGTVILDANANDSGFTATLNTGSAPAGSGAVIFQVSFNKAYASNPHVVFSPANTTAAALSGPTNVYANAVTTLVQFNAGNTGLAASNQYVWNFLITQ